MAEKTDKTTGFIDLLYTNSVGFLRDVFQYAIPGLLCLTLLLLILHNRKYDMLLCYIPELKDIIAYVALAIVLLSYICGQVIYSFSGWLFKLYKCSCINYCVDEELKSIRIKLYERLKEESPTLGSKYCKFKMNHKYCEDKEIHLFYEISIFATAPEVHGKFIERYNIMMNFRKAISGVFFLSMIAIVISIILPLASNKISDKSCELLIYMSIALLSFILSLFFHREYLRTESAFYHRVFWSYLITKKDPPKIIYIP